MKQIIWISLLLVVFLTACQPPAQQKKEAVQKHNYIILLDLSDRLVVQENQADRDKDLIRFIFKQFEAKVRREFYISSNDELSVVLAPQSFPKINRESYEERLRVNIGSITDLEKRRGDEEKRREDFNQALEDLYAEASAHGDPDDYSGADIYKFFNEDLEALYDPDPMTTNFLFVLTDGYYWVKSKDTLMDPGERFRDMNVVLLEVSPWDKDEEWDRIQGIWHEWFDLMYIPRSQQNFVKRKAISVEKEKIIEFIEGAHKEQ